MKVEYSNLDTGRVGKIIPNVFVAGIAMRGGFYYLVKDGIMKQDIVAIGVTRTLEDAKSIVEGLVFGRAAVKHTVNDIAAAEKDVTRVRQIIAEEIEKAIKI